MAAGPSRDRVSRRTIVRFGRQAAISTVNAQQNVQERRNGAAVPKSYTLDWTSYLRISASPRVLPSPEPWAIDFRFKLILSQLSGRQCGGVIG